MCCWLNITFFFWGKRVNVQNAPSRQTHMKCNRLQGAICILPFHMCICLLWILLGTYRVISIQKALYHCRLNCYIFPENYKLQSREMSKRKRITVYDALCYSWYLMQIHTSDMTLSVLPVSLASQGKNMEMKWKRTGKRPT